MNNLSTQAREVLKALATMGPCLAVVLSKVILYNTAGETNLRRQRRVGAVLSQLQSRGLVASEAITAHGPRTWSVTMRGRQALRKKP